MWPAARKRRRILLLSLLTTTVLAPIFFFSAKSSFSSIEEKEFPDDLIATRHSSVDTLQLKSIEQKELDGVREPLWEVFEEDSVVSRNFTTDSLGVKGEIKDRTANGLPGDTGLQDDTTEHVALLQNASPSKKAVAKTNKMTRERFSEPSRPVATDTEVRDMKDQMIMAKAYLQFAPPNSNSHFVRELKLRIKEIERVVSQANKDSDLSKSALQRKRAMEVSLNKARKIYPDCSAMVTKLRSMAYNTEEQLRAQKNQASYLVQLAARTFPKGLHCLSMRLTSEYFALQPTERGLPSKQRAKQSNLYHHVIFSNNVIACAVVVNSTIRASKAPDKIVFHIVTDSLNYPAITMWFLINPPGHATIQIENMDDFEWFSSTYNSMVKQPGVTDPRFTSELNYLRFYLPKIFPYLDKVLFLDHDVVVQKDLSRLWRMKMNGKVNGAVEMCGKSESDVRLRMYVNFSDPTLSKNFEPRTCVWAFGMNMFDLREWRRQGLTSEYHKWIQLAKKAPILRAGSLPLGQVTFYNHTLSIDRQWHLLGLGRDPSINRGEIEKAAVIHYDGNMKPWLEIGFAKYRGYWAKFLNYNHPFLQQCNIHE